MIGAVVIGRNEGERLRACIFSVIPTVDNLVYVDSGSTDGSVDMARTLGAEVVEIDTASRFSAGRARNAGFFHLMALHPDTKFVQFVDGDCLLDSEWIAAAKEALDANSDTAVVCGRRREIDPGMSIYNLLCDIEWNTPLGVVGSCGGDFFARTSTIASVGGFNPVVIAGEEPEMCFRIRERGFKILRIDKEMTRHNANMTRFNQWWKRTLRSGHAYAQNMVIHWSSPERLNQRKVASIFAWGMALPILLLLSVATGSLGTAAMILALYFTLLAKIAISGAREKNLSPGIASVYGMFLIVGKLPQSLGALKFVTNHFLGSKEHDLIEYK